jgi:hypothetical protein
VLPPRSREGGRSLLDHADTLDMCPPELTRRRALAASIARKIYLRSGTGVGGFRKIYGGNKNKGTRKEKFQKASGGMIRSILLNLESTGVVQKCEDGCVAQCSPALSAGCCVCCPGAQLAVPSFVPRRGRTWAYRTRVLN